MKSIIKQGLKESAPFIVVVFLVFVFRSSFYEPFRIPSGSMIPTLMIGDFILVDKSSYGFKLPFSDMSFGVVNLDPIYLTKSAGPKRGDVVVFKFPNDPSIDYIKRVVGLPGDEIEVKNKIVYINGIPLEGAEKNHPEIMNDMDDAFKGYNFKFYEFNKEKEKYIIQIDKDNFYKLNSAKVKVPLDSYFMMGDNRDYSYDSRGWGFVPFKNIKGKAVSVWMSMKFPFGKESWKLRLNRIGMKVN